MDYKKAYEIPGELPTVRVEGTVHTDVAKIFDCGQCFRFEPVAGTGHGAEYSGVAFGRFVSFAQDGDALTVYNSTLDEFNRIWRDFLCFGEDYTAYVDGIRKKSDVPALAKALEYGDGIRILRQERWECTCSFILSQNNNIPRIKKLVSALAAACGERVDTSKMRDHGAKETEYSFPSAEKVLALGVDGLAALKTGFRAKYLYDAAERACDGRLKQSDVEALTTADAMKYLCGIKGVGPKVASCVLLFGYGMYDAFPIDVWMKRVLAEYFPKDFDPAELGETAGIAQQFLFYYERYLNGGEK